MNNYRHTRISFKQNVTWYSFIIPTIATLIVLVYWPTVKTVYFSLTNMGTYGADYDFVWFQNYRILLTSKTFLTSLKNTFFLTVYSLLTIPLGFFLANTINNLGKSMTQSFFRVMYYLPNIITGVSVIMVFQYVLRANGGLLNQFLSKILQINVTIGWISNPELSHIGATILWVWMHLGYSMLMNLASIQNIPHELYEAATIDGSNSFKSLIHITIPQMKGCFSFLLITSTISGFSRFTDLYVMSGCSTAGRPNGTLQTLLMYIYQYSFETPRYGISSAGSVILFVIVLLITIVNNCLTGKEDK